MEMKLFQRIDQLEAERDRLAAQLEQAERSRDGWIDVNAAAGLALRAANDRIGHLRSAMQTACDLLTERRLGSPARSPGHNARLCLEASLENTASDSALKPRD